MIELTLAAIFVIFFYLIAHSHGIERFRKMERDLLGFATLNKEHTAWAHENFLTYREIWACVFVGLYILSPQAFLTEGPVDKFGRYSDGKLTD